MLKLFETVLTSVVGYLDRSPPSPESEDDVILTVPCYTQVNSYECGVVAGFMVARAFNPKVNFADFRELCKPTKQWGVSSKNLCSALRANGVGVRTGKTLTKKTAKAAIDDGFPLITTIKREGLMHWVVIIGYRRCLESILVPNCGISSTKEIYWEDFQKIRGKEHFLCWGK